MFHMLLGTGGQPRLEAVEVLWRCINVERKAVEAVWEQQKLIGRLGGPYARYGT